jgi:hypothetical protein
MQTAAKLLPPSTRFVEELPAGDAAHAYRFRDAGGRDLVVAWADDAKGADAKAAPDLPLAAGPWEVITWDGKGGKPVLARGPRTAVELTTMPQFLRPKE